MAAWAYCSASCPGVADTRDQAYVHPDNAPGHCGQLIRFIQDSKKNVYIIILKTIKRLRYELHEEKSNN